MLREGAGQVGKGQITRDSTGHVRDLRLPPESSEEPLMSFMQWKDWNKFEVLKDRYGGKWEEEGKLESWETSWEAVAVKQWREDGTLD